MKTSLLKNSIAGILIQILIIFIVLLIIVKTNNPIASILKGMYECVVFGKSISIWLLIIAVITSQFAYRKIYLKIICIFIIEIAILAFSVAGIGEYLMILLSTCIFEFAIIEYISFVKKQNIDSKNGATKIKKEKR